jgi:multiple sugar transport system substrate-binding protein
LAGGIAASGALLRGARPARAAEIPARDVPRPDFPVERGARLRVLRPSKFVQGDETLWLANSRRFAETTGVEVVTESVGWDDLRPKTAVAAQVGSGPDVVLAWQEDPHLFPDRLVPLDELADYLGRRYGGWFPVAETYGRKDGRWIALPIGGTGGACVHRRSWVAEAGFASVPDNFPGFLELCRRLQRIGHPAGLALGDAVGDGSWTDWVLWGFDSSDEEDRVVIDNPRTVAALEYARELHATFVPGTLSWLDPSNNKAFLAGQIGLTFNGPSIYYAARDADDAGLRAVADDIGHAEFPVGPVGRPTHAALVINACVFAYTPYPNAAREYLRFVMEREQYLPWQPAGLGYWCHPLAAYDADPVWTEDPRITPFRDVMRRALPQSYKGRPGRAAAAARAGMVVLHMFAAVCAGRATPAEAAGEAQRRGERYFGKA